LVRALQYLEASLNPDGDDLYSDILHQWKSDADARGPSSCFETALVRKAYADMAEFAQLLKLPFLADCYDKKAKRIHEAAQRELWSDEMAMLGSKCPLGVLRLHPECLEVEIPIWTGLTDPWQSFVLADWFLANCSFPDENGGLWVKEGDWWPVMWSQSMVADGDAVMIARALMLAGHYDEGGRLLETIASTSYRSASPGFSYIVYPGGVYKHGGVGGMDPATVLGAVARTTVEALFGVEPHLDQKRLVIQPRFPSHWDHAAFERAGLSMKWKRQKGSQTLKVVTPPDVQVTAVLSVHNPVLDVRVDGKPVKYGVAPAMKHASVTVELPGGGGEVVMAVDERSMQMEAPADLRVGETATVRLTGADKVEVDDRYRFFDIQGQTSVEIQVRLKKAACGRATLFLNCRVGNVSWIEPVVFSTLPKTAKEVTAQTVTEPLPAGAKTIPVDLAAAYTDDIQRCFKHPWNWDYGKYVKYQGPQGDPEYIQFLFQPIFRLTEPLPKEIDVAGIPFVLGPMGPGEQREKGNDLIMLANTDPYPLPTGVRFEVNRRLHKIYLLSLDMEVSMKSYVPAVDVAVNYEDGNRAVTQLISPLNFDTYEQDCGINTVAFPLKDIEPVPTDMYRPPRISLGYQHHLTMTDVVCDPARKVSSIEIRSIATETFFGLAGMTLAAVEE
jgi:hypothetical protein